MNDRQRDSVRLTHLPTGTVVAIDPSWFGRRADRFRIATGVARKLLLARLCGPSEAPRPVRTYDLCPPWNIPPRIREGDRVLASGADAVRRFFDGQW